jgi:ferredoxin
MHNLHTELILFSPTGTTRTVLEAIAEGLEPESISRLDLTRSAHAPSHAPEHAQSGSGIKTLALIGMPVHAGRVPTLAVERMRAIKGMGRPAVLVAVYGNRAFDDALLELRDLTRELGFVPVAGAAFIGQHSFSTPEFPVAEGRPDVTDRDRATAFGRLVRDKLDGISHEAELRNLPELQVPGNFPYREGVQAAPISPETVSESCVLCGECAQACPSAAISLHADSVTTENMLCLRCCACIRACPTGSRVMLHPRILELGRTLHAQYAQRREPEFFL